MPPLARETIDQKGVNLLNEWINGMPRATGAAAPAMSPQGGTFSATRRDFIDGSEPGTDIRYTWTAPYPSTSICAMKKPIRLTHPTVLRARAFKEGFTRSITEQQVFIVGK